MRLRSCPLSSLSPFSLAQRRTRSLSLLPNTPPVRSLLHSLLSCVLVAVAVAATTRLRPFFRRGHSLQTLISPLFRRQHLPYSIIMSAPTETPSFIPAATEPEAPKVDEPVAAPEAVRPLFFR